MPVFLSSQRISIYLSTDGEVNTLPILKEMFRLKKDVSTMNHVLLLKA